jgi:hypothetical protein
MEVTLLDSAILEASDAAGLITNSLHVSTTDSNIGKNLAPGCARTDQARANQAALGSFSVLEVADPKDV